MRCPAHEIDGSLAETWLNHCMTAKWARAERALKAEPQVQLSPFGLHAGIIHDILLLT